MSEIASQITSLTIVYSTVYSKRRSKKTSKFRVTVLWEGTSPVTGEFPAQKASNVENGSIRWRHHDLSRRDASYLKGPNEAISVFLNIGIQIKKINSLAFIVMNC